MKFTLLERLGGLRSGACIPLAQVASIDRVDDPWRVLEGMRVGTGIPWVIVLGTMLRGGGNDVVAVYGDKPAVVVTLRPGARWQRLIATVDDPDSVVDTLRRAAGR
ncbi:MAG: hypothetical protein L6Q84_05895 [Polyangiaceae bacterium]|nr:hypothetical protein [Polyangiaceae bacterium]